MQADDTSDDPLGRPLPSVNMPLLRPERRASRAKGVAVFCAAGVVGVVVLAFALGWPIGGKRGDSERPARSTNATGASPEQSKSERESSDVGSSGGGSSTSGSAAGSQQALDPSSGADSTAATRVESRFGQARGFRSALQQAGTGLEECVELEQALTKVMDFRRCRPTDRLVFERSQSGTLIGFEYHNSPIEYVRVERGPGGKLKGKRVKVPTRVVRIARGGMVRSSLGDALEKVGLRRALVALIIEAFDGRVNFSTEARAGDTFRVVVDELHLNGEFLRYGTVHALEYRGQRSGTLRAFQYAPKRDALDFYDETGRALQGGWIRTPLRYDRISSRFDLRRRHPILKRIVPHNGVDYAAGTGTQVWAAAAGKVTFAGRKGANGNLVSIRHAGGYETFYAHLHRINRGIRPGAKVTQRQPIGAVGSTGRSTGPHLHFGLKKHGRFVDPLKVLHGPGRPMHASFLPKYRARVRKLKKELAGIHVDASSPVIGGPMAGSPAAGDPSDEGAHVDAPMD